MEHEDLIKLKEKIRKAKTFDNLKDVIYLLIDEIDHLDDDIHYLRFPDED